MTLHGGGDDGRHGSFIPISIHEAAAILRGHVERDNQGREVIRCPGPGHSKDDLSLSVWLDPDEPGGIGVHSFSAKDSADPLALKDWVRAELGLPQWKPNGHGNGHAKGKHDGRDPDPIVEKYEYQTATGEPVLLVTRTKAKRFWQNSPDGAGGWKPGGVPESAKVPYRLGDLIEGVALGKPVFVCEGEKAVNAMSERGYVATCSPGGAEKWPRHFSQWFGGAVVFVLADNDKPGAKHAEKVEANLTGTALAVRTINLPGLKPGGDVFDFLADGGDPATIADMRSGPPPRGKTARELWRMDFAAVRFAVPNLIAEGLTLLAGAPKRGKSWLALDVCVAVANGGFTLGDQKCIAGDVLYCALEDSPRRMKARLKTVCQLHEDAPGRLTVWFGEDLPRLGNGCEEALEDWLNANPGARLIVIDTLNYIRPERVRDEDPYTYDYRSATTLQRLAIKHGIAIVLVHHTRKSAADDYLESISGTNGLTGGCDAVCVLERQGDGSTVFKGRGRDVEEFELAVKFDKDACRWSVLGGASEAREGEAKNKILSHLREAGWFMPASEIASQTGLSRNTVNVTLYRLIKSGEVIKAGRNQFGLPSAEIVTLRPEPDE